MVIRRLFIGGEDVDGLRNILIDFDETTTWVELRNKGLYALEREAEINTALSVMMEKYYRGDLTLNTRFHYYYGAAKPHDGYEDGRTKSLSSLLTATYNGITTPLKPLIMSVNKLPCHISVRTALTPPVRNTFRQQLFCAAQRPGTD